MIKMTLQKPKGYNHVTPGEENHFFFSFVGLILDFENVGFKVRLIFLQT